MHLSALGLMTLEHSTPLGLMTLEHSRTVTHTYKLPYLHALRDCLFIQVTHYNCMLQTPCPVLSRGLCVASQASGASW